MSKKLNLSAAARLREAFVAGREPDRSPSVHTDIHASVQKDVSLSGAVPARAPAAPLRKHFTFSLDIALHQRLRVRAAVENRQMRDLIEDSLGAYLNARERSGD